MNLDDEEKFIEGNIPLVINAYIDIFSSFDSRPLSEKALSVDFLSEVKRAARDKNEFGLEVTISVPKEKRNLTEEFKIKKRLREHFHKHFLEKEHEMKKVKQNGIKWVFIGVLILLAILFGLIFYESNKYVALIAIFEVPCWFLIWEGMGKILLESKKSEPDYYFYKKMANAQITFKSY